MKRHSLKTWPAYFGSIWDGDKTFELRYDDRDYEVGDVLLLEEWEPQSQRYTSRWVEAYVSYMARAPGFQHDVPLGDERCALGKGWVVMSIVVCRKGDGR